MANMSNPVAGGYGVVPADDADLEGGVCAGLWVGTAGDLEVVTKDGSSLVFVNASGWMPVQARRVMAGNTTAANIIAYYGSPG